MSKRERVILLLFILYLLLFLGLIFSGWVVPNIVRPAAETIWLFLRVFILNVDQAYYWNILIIAILFWVFYRLARRTAPARQKDITVQNESVNNLKNWQEFIDYASRDARMRSIARDKLLRLVISHYTVRQPSVDQAEIRQELEQGRLPLPVSVYGFLFESKPATANDSFKEKIIHPFHRWRDRRTGQEKLAFSYMIDELIRFLDS